MTYYYILEDGTLVDSKWEKQIGESHLKSKIQHIIDKKTFDYINQERIRNHNREVRRINNQINKSVDLWLAGQILAAGNRVGLNVEDTLNSMKDLAPNSLNELKKYILNR